jgi:hypothetical protein
MTASRNLDAAMQYLTWGLEEIEKFGDPKAALHVRNALDQLRGVSALPSHDTGEAKRFRDKADEAEQLAELAETASRRDALMNIAETYRRTAEQMNRVAEAQTKTKSK